MDDKYRNYDVGIKRQMFPSIDQFLKIQISNFLSITITITPEFELGDEEFTFIYRNVEYKVKLSLVRYFIQKLAKGNSDTSFTIPFELSDEVSEINFDEYEGISTDNEFFINGILNSFFNGSTILINQHTYKIIEFISQEENLDIPAFRKICDFFNNFYVYFNQFEQLADIQDVLLDIAIYYQNDKQYRLPFDDCVKQLSEMIANNETITKDMFLLYSIISQAAVRRPQNVKYYAAIVKMLGLPKPEGYGLPIISKFREIYLQPINHNIDSFFLQNLMLAGVFTVEEVLNCVKESTNLPLKILFAPYFTEADAIDGILDRINSLNNIQERNGLLASFEALRADNWKLHKLYTEEGANDSQIATLIRRDDVEGLQTFLSTENGFNVDSTIPFSVFEHIPFLMNNPSLIQYAAFYGSVNCFKYLFLSHASLKNSDLNEKTVLDYAVAGGNPEIVRICQQNAEYGFPLSSAALFYRFAIFDYFDETVVPTYNIDVQVNDYSKALESAIIAFNFRLIEQLFMWAGPGALFHAASSGNSIVFDTLLLFDTKLENLTLALAFSSNSYDFDMVKKIYSLLRNRKGKSIFSPISDFANHNSKSYLVINSIKHDDCRLFQFIHETIDPIDFWEKIAIAKDDDVISFSAAYGALRCLKYIFAQINLKPEDLDKEYCPLLRIAAMYNQYEVFKYLLELPSVNLNSTDEGGGSAFTAATWDNQIPFVKLLYKRGGVNINAKGRLGETPLTGTVVQKIPKMMELLLSYPDIDVYAVNKDGDTAMMLSIKKEEIDCYYMLLKCDKFDINSPKACSNCSTAIYALKLRSITSDMLNLIINSHEINLDEIYNGRPIGDQLKEKAAHLK